MKIFWESLNFNEQELIEAMKTRASDEEDIPTTLFQGPFSVESILDPMSLSKRHRLIIGHCDFNLSSRRALSVMKVRGVDLLKVLTRYSFVFSPGKAFDEDVVKSAIEKILCVENKSRGSEVDDLIAMLKQENKKYCIYSRDGQVNYVTEDDLKYETMLSLYMDAKEKYGGSIYEG
jgi:hypothetical protein